MQAQKVFFCHVMKTGGTNLSWPVRKSMAPEQYFPHKKDYRFVDGRLDLRHHFSVAYLTSLPAERRREIQVYAGHYPFFAVEALGDVLGEQLATLAILRDPVERTLSLLRVYGRPGAWVGEQAKDWPMRSWPLERLYEDPEAFEPLIHNHQTRVFSVTAADGVDTYRDVIDLDESRLAQAKRNIETLDVLGVNERYGDLLADVSARFGWDVPTDTRRNPAPGGDPRPASAAFRRRIAEDNAFDVELHEHAKELVAARHRS